MKRCCLCKAIYPFSYFNAHPYNKDHLDYRCRQCKTIQKREWRRENTDKEAANSAKRRTMKTTAGGYFTDEEFQSLKAEWDHRCLKCGKRLPLTPDHILPVKLGGPSWIWNIQPLCFSCNSSKNNKIIDYRPVWLMFGDNDATRRTAIYISSLTFDNRSYRLESSLCGAPRIWIPIPSRGTLDRLGACADGGSV